MEAGSPFWSEVEVRANGWLLCFSDLQVEPQYLSVCGTLMCLCVHICVFVCMDACGCMFAYMCVGMHVGTCAYACVCMWEYICVWGGYMCI